MHNKGGYCMSYMVLIPEQISNAGIEYLKERGYIVDYDPSYTDEIQV
jgi:hypothetical protein